MRDSDWSREKLLRSDWLPIIGATMTTIWPNPRHDLSSVVEPKGQHHSSPHPLSVNKILEQKRSMTSEFLCTVITKTKLSNLIGSWQP